MINRLSHSDDLGGVREKVNQIVDLLVFENPMSAIEGVAEKHLKSHNKEIAETRDELKEVLEQVKKETESLQIIKKEISDSIKEIKEDLSKSIEGIVEGQKEFESKVIAQQKEFESKIISKQEEFKSFESQIIKNQKEFESKVISELSKVQQEGNDNKETIRKFITFYSQVGLHVKELCDGKK